MLVQSIQTPLQYRNAQPCHVREPPPALRHRRVTSPQVSVLQGEPQDDTTPPTSPGTPADSNVTATSATLTWTASTDQGGSGLAGYNVYREQGATDPLLGQSTTNPITLTGLTTD